MTDEQRKAGEELVDELMKALEGDLRPDRLEDLINRDSKSQGKCMIASDNSSFESHTHSKRDLNLKMLWSRFLIQM